MQLSLGVDEIYTLTTVTTGQRGDHGEPPVSAPFPIDYFSYYQSKNPENTDTGGRVGGHRLFLYSHCLPAG